MISYRKRDNVFEKGESEWRVEPDALVYRNPSGGEKHLPWNDVKQVRIQYAPTRMKTQRYLFEIVGKHGRQFSIDSMHFVGIANFEERSATYTPFVRAALEKVKEQSPDAPVYLGASPASYLMQVVFVTIAFAAFAALFFIIPVFDVMSGTGWVKLAIVLLALPFFFRWLYTAYPREADLNNLPDYVLPKVDNET